MDLALDDQQREFLEGQSMASDDLLEAAIDAFKQHRPHLPGPLTA